MHALCAGKNRCDLRISGNQHLSIPLDAIQTAIMSYSSTSSSSSSSLSTSSSTSTSTSDPTSHSLTESDYSDSHLQSSSFHSSSLPSSSISSSQDNDSDNDIQNTENNQPTSHSTKSHHSTSSLSSSSFSLQSSSNIGVTDICQSIFTKNDTLYCNTTLSYNGNFNNCGKNVGIGLNGYTYSKEGKPRKNLIFEAVCITELIQLGEITKQSFAKTEKLLLIVSLLDAISIVIFVVGITWLRYQIEKEGIAADRDQCTASDYTIACYTMPKEKTNDHNIKNKLLNHFETVLNENRNLPKNCIENVPDEEIKIADINCSTRCTSYLTAAVERGSAAVVVDKMIAKIRNTLSEERVRRSVITLKKLETNINTLDNVAPSVLYALKVALYRFEHYNDKCLALHGAASSNIYSAYITFESEFSYASCLKQIPNIGIWTRLTQEKKYKLDGQTLFITVIINFTVFDFTVFILFYFHFYFYFLPLFIFHLIIIVFSLHCIFYFFCCLLITF